MVMKNLTDITVNDLEEYFVWYFPRDEIDGDEFLIKPIKEEITHNEYGFIVKTIFKTPNNQKYTGFIHHQAPYTLDAIQPAVILDDNFILYFWKGMFLPDDETMQIIKRKTPDDFYPLTYKSLDVLGLQSFEGVLEGLYHFDMKKNIQVAKY